jgi:hypothetical protein
MNPADMLTELIKALRGKKSQCIEFALYFFLDSRSSFQNTADSESAEMLTAFIKARRGKQSYCIEFAL